MREALTPEQQEKWDGVVAEGASIYEFLRLTQEPTKKDWIKEFTKKANYKLQTGR